jgi:hypothetical protein
MWLPCRNYSLSTLSYCNNPLSALSKHNPAITTRCVHLPGAFSCHNHPLCTLSFRTFLPKSPVVYSFLSHFPAIITRCVLFLSHFPIKITRFVRFPAIITRCILFPVALSCQNHPLYTLSCCTFLPKSPLVYSFLSHFPAKITHCILFPVALSCHNHPLFAPPTVCISWFTAPVPLD